MPISIHPGYRAAGIGVASAALLVGAFTLGSSRGGSPAAPQSQSATLTASSTPAPGTRITVTGTGTVTGTPNQLLLSMSVQVNSSSVGSALAQANQTARKVTAALRGGGVAAADIQTSDLSISPNYQGNSQVPVSYGVSESLTATLNNLSKAGSQIQAAVHAGGNAVTVDNVSVNLTNTSKLLAAARARAVTDARTQAAQYAAAAGEHLGPVISITPQQPSPVFYGPANAPSAKAASSVPISPGSQQVSVSITVVYSA